MAGLISRIRTQPVNIDCYIISNRKGHYIGIRNPYPARISNRRENHLRGTCQTERTALLRGPNDEDNSEERRMAALPQTMTNIGHRSTHSAGHVPAVRSIVGKITATREDAEGETAKMDPYQNSIA